MPRWVVGVLGLALAGCGAGRLGATGAQGEAGPPGPAGAGDCLSIESYGGVGDGKTDNAAALRDALAALPESGGCISFEAGKYAFSAAVSTTLAASGVDSVSVLGAGADATVLAWPTAGGGLSFTFDGLGDSVHIRDVSLTVAQPAGGTALTLTQNYSAPGLSSGINAVSDLTSVTIRGDDGYAASDYWSTGLSSDGVSNIDIENCEFEGPGLAAYSTNGNGIILFGDAQTPALGVYAVVFNVVNTSFNLLNAGIVYGTFTQGVAVSQCNFTGDSYGIVSNGNEAGLGELAVSNSQFNCGAGGIVTSSAIDGLMVTSSFFLVPANASGIFLDQCAGTALTGDEFAGLGAAANGVVVNQTLAGPVITGNLFEDLETAVWLQPQSTAVVVQDNSYTADQTPVLDQGTSNTVSTN